MRFVHVSFGFAFGNALTLGHVHKFSAGSALCAIPACHEEKTQNRSCSVYKKALSHCTYCELERTALSHCTNCELTRGSSVSYIGMCPTGSPECFCGGMEMFSRPDDPGLVPASGFRLGMSTLVLRFTASMPTCYDIHPDEI